MSESFISLYSDGSNISTKSHHKLIEVGSLTDISIKESESSVSELQFDMYVLPCDYSEQIATFTNDGTQSVAQRCINSLQRIRSSLHSDSTVVVSQNLSMDKRTWDLQLYQRGSELPVENVPLKVNIIKTLVQTLDDYLRPAENDIKIVESVAHTLQYLNKLVQASLLNNIHSQSVVSPLAVSGSQNVSATPSMLMGPPNRRPTLQDREQSHRSVFNSKRKTSGGAGSDTSSVHSNHTGSSKSSVSVKSKQNIFQKMKGMSRWSQHSSANNNGMDANSSTNSRSNRKSAFYPKFNDSASNLTKSSTTHKQNGSSATPKEPVLLKTSTSHFKDQDLTGMPHYIHCIQQLTKQALRLPQTSQNDIIFSFINKCIIPFILHDSALLQTKVIETNVLAPFIYAMT